MSAHAAAGAACSIVLMYDERVSRAAGLAAKNADPSGGVTWTWRVDTDAPAGVWPTKVTCDGQSATTYLYVP